MRRIAGGLALATCTAIALSLLTWTVTDPSLTHISSGAVRNWMGPLGAIVSDLLVQLLGIASVFVVLPPAYWAIQLLNQGHLANPKRRLVYTPLAVACFALAWSSMPEVTSMPFKHGYGGVLGDFLYARATGLLAIVNATRAGIAAGLFGVATGLFCLQRAFGVSRAELTALFEVSRSAFKAAMQPAKPSPMPAASLAIDPQPWTQPQPTPMHGAIQVPYAAVQTYPQPHTAPQVWPSDAYAVAPHMVAPQMIVPTAYMQHQMAAQQPWPVQPSQHATQHTIQPVYAQPIQAHHAQSTLIPEPVQAARQAWLRPMQHRIPKPSPQQAATDASARLSATDRRHVPGFDRETDQQSRAIAERFAPSSSTSTAPPLVERPLEPTHRSESVHQSEHAPALQSVRVPDAPDAELPEAHVPARPATPRDPEIFLSPVEEPVGHMPMVDRAHTVAPGGFFARLTTGQRQADGNQHFKRPSLNLLQRAAAPQRHPDITTAKLQERSRQLLETLGDFGIKGDIVAVRPGPVVTLFEFEPARGTKSSRVIGLADDIARSMSARAVRIAVVPGVNAIGIELPNATREPVGFRELLETDAFRANDAKLPLALGKGIGGEPVIADLTRMPHLLVAGTTGSGKSVGVNAMILSLLYQLSPDDCRLILIDPKMLELSVYNGIPHLLTPVVTDPGKAVAALNWAVGEMENRYRRMSALNVRNIEVYNNRIRNAVKRDDQRGLSADTDATPMPHIVIVVDEFADLMAVAGKEIEFAVQRLAQMARAAGIHLIMATQRPSVDIITGTIKANFPTRISFRVTSRIDSRTILNEQGAEQLLGQGDMLFAGGSGQIVRVHGPFVSDEEVESIAAYLRTQGTPDYVDGITDIPDLEADEKAAEVLDEDHLYDRAVSLVRADKKASISYLQRKLSIGYNRAADIIDRMEVDGLVSAPNAAGKRELLPMPEPAAREPADA